MTYDDNSLRWNGADLLTRVARKSVGEENKTIKRMELNEEPSHIFFPINSQDITSKKECPTCRVHCPSKRSLRDDPSYDAMIKVLYPNIDQSEKKELTSFEEELDLPNKKNKKVIYFSFSIY